MKSKKLSLSRLLKEASPFPRRGSPEWDKMKADNDAEVSDNQERERGYWADKEKREGAHGQKEELDRSLGTIAQSFRALVQTLEQSSPELAGAVEELYEDQVKVLLGRVSSELFGPQR